MAVEQPKFSSSDDDGPKGTPVSTAPDATETTASPVVNEAPKVAPVDADYAAFLQWKASQSTPKEISPEEYYVHLADGECVRVRASDFPVSLTVNGGHFEKDGNVYAVIGVYPVEEKAA